MVDNQTKNLQWKIFLCSTSRANQIFRGIEEGLRCFLSQDYHAGSMVFCRESFVLKCYGIGSSKASNSFIYKTLSLFLSYLSYLNMGGTQNKHLIEIWGHLIETKIHLTAEHILCLSNQTADWDSRNFQDSTEQKLWPTVFKQICSHLEKPLLDLFASGLCNQLPRYIA